MSDLVSIKAADLRYCGHGILREGCAVCALRAQVERYRSALRDVRETAERGRKVSQPYEACHAIAGIARRALEDQP